MDGKQSLTKGSTRKNKNSKQTTTKDESGKLPVAAQIMTNIARLTTAQFPVDILLSNEALSSRHWPEAEHEQGLYENRNPKTV